MNWERRMDRKRAEPPPAKPRKSLEWLIEHGCELQRPELGTLVAIYDMSNGNPCRECNCKDTCPA